MLFIHILAIERELKNITTKTNHLATLLFNVAPIPQLWRLTITYKQSSNLATWYNLQFTFIFV